MRVTTRFRQQEFDVACLLGYITKEYRRLADADAPAGIILLPVDPGVTALLHQFAISLLALPEACPSDWICPYNRIRDDFNAPPPDHERPTAAFSLSDVRAYAAQLRRIRQPLDEGEQGTSA